MRNKCADGILEIQKILDDCNDITNGNEKMSNFSVKVPSLKYSSNSGTESKCQVCIAIVVSDDVQVHDHLLVEQFLITKT